jgi:CBS domain-containing protein
MRDLTVATVMTKDPVTATPDTKFDDILALLGQHGINAVPVVRWDGTPVGVVSATDLDAVPGGTAKDVMSPRVLAVDAGESVNFAARELHRRGVRRLFVLDHGRLVGVVSRRDLLKVFLRSDDEIRLDVEREVFQRVLWADPSAVAVTVVHGVVTLAGTLERRSDVEIAARLTGTVPGVVQVRNRLNHTWDDRRVPVR